LCIYVVFKKNHDAFLLIIFINSNNIWYLSN